VPTSLAPIAQDSFDFEPFERAEGRWRKRIQFTLVALALIGGTFTTLHRNDLLFTWANSFQKGAAYLDFEKRWLGGAPAGTPREIDALLGRSPALPGEGAVNTTSLVSAAVIQNPLEAQAAPAAKPELAVADAPSEAAAKSVEDTSEKNAAAAPAGNLGAAKSVEDLPLQAESRSGRSKSAAAPLARSRVASSTRARENDEDRQESRKAKSDTPKPNPASPDFLEASIRDAVKNSDKKSKKRKRKGKKSDSYDPLNGDF
jgi:hypothetical protein